jgi:threonine/homoserine/homoserine lactone efflux protein
MLERYGRRKSPVALAADIAKPAVLPLSLLASGLATNLTNPKAWVF